MGANLIVTGLVLSAMPMGEYDKRITLLTKERGKITAFARGARRPNSQLLAATNPFSFGEFELFEGRSTYTVAKATISNYFRNLAYDPEAAYYGFYFLEFADYYCQENSDEKEMLKLLYQTLRALESERYDNRLVRAVFELKALAVNGEAPNVFGCLGCGKKEQLFYFSVRKGGILCDTCRKKAEDAWKVTESTVYTIQYVIASEIAKLYSFAVSEQVLEELQKILAQYTRLYINHDFKSLKILEEIS
ncbi:MAG: DNA repair protein RecO [Roseburia sp.]|nr:DNA repair protein RecO [Roseburia sp.]